MNTIQFYTSYEKVVSPLLKFNNEYTKLPHSEQAEKTVSLRRDMDKLFATFIKDELTGNKIDLFA
jgi:hypothetical protein